MVTPIAATNRKNNPIALASGLLGLGFVVLSLVGMFVPVVLLGASIPGVIGLVLGIIGLVQLGKNHEQKGRGWAITGIIIGVISLLALCLYPILGMVILGPDIETIFNNINSGLNTP